MHHMSQTSATPFQGPPPVVFVLDDNEDVLATLSLMLDRQGFAPRAFLTSDLFFAACGETPACVLIDWRLGSQDGLEIAARCRREMSRTAVILISGSATVEATVRAMRLGVETVLPKPIEPKSLAAEVRAAIQRTTTRETIAIERSVARRRIDALHPRERDVLELVVQGTPNKCIASQLSMAVRTVEKRRRQLFDALNVDSAAEATRIFVLATLED